MSQKKTVISSTLVCCFDSSIGVIDLMLDYTKSLRPVSLLSQDSESNLHEKWLLADSRRSVDDAAPVETEAPAVDGKSLILSGFYTFLQIF